MKKVVIPTYTPTSDTEMLGKSKKELSSLAEGKGRPATRAKAELERRKGNAPFKAWKRAQKAAAA